MQLSGTQEVAGLVLGVIGAFIGYWLSERDRKRLGRTPWGLVSLLWALFWLLSPLVGLILYLFAHASEVRRAHRFPPVPGSPMAGAGPAPMPPMPPAPAPTVSELFPSYPRPANTQPSSGEHSSPVPSPGSAPPYPANPPTPDMSPPRPVGPGGQGAGDATMGDPDPAAGEPAASGWPHSPPAWHPDPSGRFHYRWWDGQQWTSHVSINGQYLIDTNPDQRIGPY